MWTQLKLIDGVLSHVHAPGPTSDVLTVPVMPHSLQQQALQHSHNDPSAGHQGADKTLARLQEEYYWVNMSQDVERYCHEFVECQQAKLRLPSRAPLTSMPIGNPWKMVAVDVLTVPVTQKGSRYLLVVQDYFTKWADTIPLPDQSACTITTALIKLFSVLGMPDVVHSDQGHNFESAMLK